MPKARLVLVALPHPIYSPQVWAQVDAFDSYLTAQSYPALDLRTQTWTSEIASYIEGGVHPTPTGNADLAVSVEGALKAATCL